MPLLEMVGKVPTCAICSVGCVLSSAGEMDPSILGTEIITIRFDERMKALTGVQRNLAVGITS
jgi:hypothetical protein